MAFQQYPQKFGIPSGNTAGRPANPVIGDTYYDGTLGFLFIFDGTNFIPCSAPASQPTIVVTDVGTGVAYGTVQGSVAFTEGVSGGKAAGFTAIQGNTTSTSTSSPIVLTITGNPGSYSFNGTAFNGFGTSPQSLSVSQTLTSVPEAPTIGTATGGDASISLTFTAGATGGKSISNYKYSLDGTTYTALSPASTTSPITISGLTNGTSYTVRLKAVNANGDSAASSASNSATPEAPIVVDYLVVAGGGSGGNAKNNNSGTAGGGGAGGLRSTVTATGRGGTLETALNITKGTNYTVTVGAGGATAGTNQSSNSGSNSVFSTITSTGGGGGSGGASGGNALNGGCGGGAGDTDTTGAAGTTGQGYDGGDATATAQSGAGGGGGAGANGGSRPELLGNQNGVSGAGGAGVAVSITGSSVTYAGGGGGGGSNQASGQYGATAGAGGTGGGGAGGAFNGNGTNGTANLGGGGGGGGAGGDNSGAGGSGVVILRYLTSAGTITIGAGLTGSTATSGSYKVTTLTAGTGNVSWA
jgi:hypothetical protein